MAGTVTYKAQPAIHQSRGAIPLAGTKHVYKVGKVLWPIEIERFLESLFIGPTLHVCCGKSKIGDVLVDLHEPSADICADASNMRGFVGTDEFSTVLCDPPYNGKFQWNHDLLSELARVAHSRIIFQHWFIPATPLGHYRKAQAKFALSAVYVWQPRTYFGRVQVVSVFDRRTGYDGPLSGIFDPLDGVFE